MILLGKVHVFTYTVQPTDLQRLEIGGTSGKRHMGTTGGGGRGYRGTNGRRHTDTTGGNGGGATGALVGGDTLVPLGEWGRGFRGTNGRRHMGNTGGMGAGLQGH